MRRTVVGAPVWIAHGMSELVFDEVRPDAEHFIKNRPCHCPEAVTAHFILFDAHASHGRENCVVAHRSLVAPRPRKDIAPTTRERMQFAQDIQGLFGEGDNMRGVGLGHGIAPLCRVQVYVHPFSFAQFAWAYKYQWRKAQGAAHRKRAFVAIHCTKNLSNLFRICRCR